MKKTILLLCHDTVGKKLAGPGIRYKNLQRVISKKYNVKLGLLVEKKSDYSGDSSTFPILTSGNSFEKHFNNIDFIYSQWLSDEMIAYAKKIGVKIIFDFYAPIPVEFLASKKYSANSFCPEDSQIFHAISSNIIKYLQVGDAFLCSNQVQQDFWNGYLFATKGLSLNTSTNDLNNLILKSPFLLCPMGVESKKPIQKSHPIRTMEGIDKNDFVMLWTGGVWDWFDTEKIILAVKKLSEKGFKIKLVFMGMTHPNKNIKEMHESIRTRALVKKLDLYNKLVFFNDDWVDYNSRADFLMDADCAIYSDKESLETRYAHRTRVLDHIWAGLPTLCSEGDYLSEYIVKNELGLSFDRNNIESIMDAVLKVKSDINLNKIRSDAFNKARSDLSWENTLKPLLEYIETTEKFSLSETSTHAFQLSNAKSLSLKNSRRRIILRNIKRKLLGS